MNVVTQRVFPMLAYEDPAAAIDWLAEAFGFKERGERYVMEDGTIGHAEVDVGGATLMLATPTREYQSPKTHRKSCEAAARWLDNPWVVDGLLVLVDDLEAHHARAVAAGANVIRPLEEARMALSTPRRTWRDTAGCSSTGDNSSERRERS